MEIRVDGPFRKTGSSISTIWITLPSPGARTRPSPSGVLGVGFRKKYRVNTVRRPVSTAIHPSRLLEVGPKDAPPNPADRARRTVTANPMRTKGQPSGAMRMITRISAVGSLPALCA